VEYSHSQHSSFEAKSHDNTHFRTGNNPATPFWDESCATGDLPFPAGLLQYEVRAAVKKADAQAEVGIV
jgi:hypothetical protein